MRKSLYALFMILVFSSICMAEEVKPAAPENQSPFALGMHFGFHFFNPQDVNDYIEYDLEQYSVETGFTSIILCFDLGLDLKYMANESLGVKFGVDGLLAPKLVTVQDYYTGATETEVYALSGICLSAMGLFSVPVDNDMSFFIGAGPDFYYSSFEDYSGYGFGGRVQAGVMLAHGTEISLVGRIAKIPNKKSIDTGFGSFTPDFDMDYTGIELKMTYYPNF